MTDAEIIEYLKGGGTANYGCHGHNMEIVNLIADLERQGLVKTADASTSQETRRNVWWIGPVEKGDD